MAKEIERKFLVSSDAWRDSCDDGTVLKQAYVVTMDDRSVRVRTFAGKHAKLTMKIGKGAMTRDEYEYDIPLEEAEELFSHAVGLVIEKTRYRVPADGFVWEIDIYSGALEGLEIAEVEMQSEEDQPELPAWLGREVTGDHRYSNQSLATEPLALARVL